MAEEGKELGDRPEGGGRDEEDADGPEGGEPEEGWGGERLLPVVEDECQGEEREDEDGDDQRKRGEFEERQR